MRTAWRRPLGRLCCFGTLLIAALGVVAPRGEAQGGPATTTVADTVYMADGTVAQGTLIITWPAFVTAGGAAVAAGTTNVTLGPNGALSVALVPNAGATPAGVYYTVVYQLGPSEVRTESWVVPTTSPVNLAGVIVTPGSSVAGAAVSVEYVNSQLATKANDNSVVHLSGTETITGAKTFASAPSVPTPTSSTQVATKGYVDGTVECLNASTWAKNVGPAVSEPGHRF